MKKKLCICLSTLLVLSTLTGCNADELKQKLPWNKGNVQVDIETEEGPSHQITINNGQEFESGTEISYADVAVLNDEDSMNLVKVIFVSNDGTMTETYVIPEVDTNEERTVDIMMQFMDGSDWSGTITFVAIPSNKIIYPEPLATNLRNKEWYSGDFNGTVVSTTYPNNTGVFSTGLISSYNQFSGSNFIKFDKLSGYDSEDFKNGPTRVFYVESWSEDSDLTKEQSDTLSQFADTVREKLIMTGGVDFTNYVIYNSDGLPLQVSRAYFILDGQLTNESPKKITTAYIFDDLMGSTIAITPEIGVTDFDYTLFMSDENFDFKYDFDASEEDNLSTFSETAYLSSWINTITYNAELLDDCIEDLTYNTFLGEVVKLETQAQQSTGEIVDAPSDLQIDVGSGDAQTEASNDELIQVKPTYQSKHPGIYQWPENDIKYRRWDYVINNEVNFNGIIVMPDGTIIRSSDNDEEYEFNGGSYISGSETGSSSTGKSNADTYELVSAYGTYKLSAEGFQNMEFQKNLSTSGRLVFTYNKARFYIETGRASTINNYLANSIYSTDNYNGGVFEVQEVTDRVRTDYGNITDYLVQYTPKSGSSSKKSAYMSVYNINNDYLICYSDELIDNLTIMRDLLQGMVTVE